ncbi:MAG TPA: helix-turn-helix transcriptional regulator, partial [Longimicrobium sp.]|nr:helix-turn-helix transcriptional regulator [Longimicrobium sp.]
GAQLLEQSGPEFQVEILEEVQGGDACRAQLARDAGLSYAALHAWITGIRSPRAGSLVQLAEGLESRADALRELAAQLRRAAERR